MSITRIPFHLMLAAVVAFAVSPSALAESRKPQREAAQAPAPSSLAFNGARYAHRWSKGNQHEFTPAGQEDLSAWRDMITLVPRQEVRDGETLAALAESLLAQYKSAGKIIKTGSTPRTDSRPAEHFLIALLPGQGFLETVFVRFKLVDGTGVMAIYAHRNYGEAAAQDFGVWLQANGATVEQALMAWSDIPAPASLETLPQSR
ncbi:hypothetical protein K4L06_01230 [Lysobacter sp. BMK333-48F3]|uniref:hypothetical protein n=1 Tax=Lysobacter sp. BMK333-48F3 TaxID=2867962 RepID=UPI001C8B6AE8|nr:hypothetical protein [Lysobacter sp. BMK333-48F3]MBX9399917.1 hypothetical protein [Lysobacter sp. BMK333-48F3]